VTPGNRLAEPPGSAFDVVDDRDREELPRHGGAWASLGESRSPAMQAIHRRVGSVARTSAPVVLQGETGTGKEVLARAIHQASPRAARPFVPVNCGALPGELLESELFGHVRGAFSGAVADRAGLFQAAQGGTLLLDEVADLPISLQVKLLRVLQGGEVRRVGANQAQAVDVRVIVATHKDLDALVRDHLFREDLYFRLKVFTFRLPPLRERAEDVIPLARHLLQYERAAPCRISPVAEAVLRGYRWPGNVRELANAMRHAAALAEGDLIELQHLPEEVVRAAGPRPPPRALPSLEQVEREHILAVLEACSGVQAMAARVLGIARNTLGRKLRAYGLSVPEEGQEPPVSPVPGDERAGPGSAAPPDRWPR
jgi:DNA-binding NtrC family response regulator